MKGFQKVTKEFNNMATALTIFDKGTLSMEEFNKKVKTTT